MTCKNYMLGNNNVNFALKFWLIDKSGVPTFNSLSVSISQQLLWHNLFVNAAGKNIRTSCPVQLYLLFYVLFLYCIHLEVKYIKKIIMIYLRMDPNHTDLILKVNFI